MNSKFDAILQPVVRTEMVDDDDDEDGAVDTLLKRHMSSLVLVAGTSDRCHHFHRIGLRESHFQPSQRLPSHQIPLQRLGSCHW